jgi:hypothetical protein
MKTFVGRFLAGKKGKQFGPKLWLKYVCTYSTAAHDFFFSRDLRRSLSISVFQQSDQIGRLFTLGSFFENYKSSSHFWATIVHKFPIFNFGKIEIGRFFPGTHLVTLFSIR